MEQLHTSSLSVHLASSQHVFRVPRGLSQAEEVDERGVCESGFGSHMVLLALCSTHKAAPPGSMGGIMGCKFNITFFSQRSMGDEITQEDCLPKSVSCSKQIYFPAI